MVSATRLLPLVFLALAACSQPPVTDPPPGAVAELWTAETRTILTGEAAQTLALQCSRVSPGPIEDVWTPGEADVTLLEALLAPLLAEKLGRGVNSPSDYYRQYAGFIIGGRRVVYINGFHRAVIARGDALTETAANAPEWPWRTQAVQICDGGPVTFGVEYDPATQRFSNFAFNGAI